MDAPKRRLKDEFLNGGRRIALKCIGIGDCSNKQR
jgi:hypothetical protein